MAKRKAKKTVLPLANHLLIAMPSMRDENFLRSVTFICEHNEKGAMGLVINRPLKLTEQELFDHLNIATVRADDRPVFAGGPVQIDRGFVIHRPYGDWNSSWHVNEDIAVTTSKDILEAMSHGEGPADAFIALGYAGWGAGQLEAELAANAWLTVPVSSRVIFDVPYEKRWEEATRLLGIDPAFLATDGGHA